MRRAWQKPRGHLRVIEQPAGPAVDETKGDGGRLRNVATGGRKAAFAEAGRGGGRSVPRSRAAPTGLGVRGAAGGRSRTTRGRVPDM